MGSQSVKTPADAVISRRALLSGGVGAALALATGRGATAQDQPAPRFPWIEGKQARVVDIRSARIVRSALVDRAIVADMIEQGVAALARQPDAPAAWRTILGDAERITVKFNSVGSDVIATNDALASVLLDQLRAAGRDPAKLVFVEAPPNFAARRNLAPLPEGWGPSIDVGGNPEPITRWLTQSDAVINVGLLKTHRIAGMSGCLKNISHAVVRHPARYHDNHCSPAVPLIFSNPLVAPRIKLNLVNAIRCVVDRGPDAVEGDISWYGGLLLGFDPVATDVVARAVLEEERRRRGLMQRVEVPYLKAAADLGLGRYRLSEIERFVVERDG